MKSSERKEARDMKRKAEFDFSGMSHQPTIAELEQAVSDLPESTSSVFVYRNRRGRGHTELSIKDGIPIMAHSVIKELSGRIRNLRIWTHGQPQSTRIRCAIAAWKRTTLQTKYDPQEQYEKPKRNEY